MPCRDFIRRTMPLAAGVLVVATSPIVAQRRDPTLSVKRIYVDQEFRSAPMPSPAWMRDGVSYLELRPGQGGGADLVRVDVLTGKESTIVPASSLVDERDRRLDVEEVQLSEDETKALVFHNSVPVWRNNTRGIYHVVNIATRKVRPVSTRAGLQMFARFSPNGTKVAFVRDNNLFVTDLASGREDQLTRDGSSTIINGTTDWVYEEELSLADAFRWSPDGRRIAFWRFDQSPIPLYPLINELSLYPTINTLRYPKAGAANSRVRLGVITLGRGSVTWLDVGAGSDQYLARMDWVGADSVVVQRLPRAQTSVDVLMVSAASGKPRLVFTEHDSAYVDVEEGDLHWIDAARQFLWLSDRSGWRQLYLYDRGGKVVRQITHDGADVLEIAGVDEKSGVVYVTVAGPTPAERNIYRYSLRGTGAGERVTSAAGTHAWSVAPGARFAIDIHSTLAMPPVATVYELASMSRRRVVEDNAELVRRLGTLDIRPPQLIAVPMPDGASLDGWRIVPPAFDSTRKYPVIMFVYGGPAAPTVNDEWGGSNYLWHQLLAQQGYVVVSVDNRGAAWRGRTFRKMTQLRLGVQESQDQIDVARWLGRQSWGDARRIGIWGWSYGGYLSALSAARGGDVFRIALVVAPVTDWRLYDTIYTERYMRTPQQNPEGYRLSSVYTYVDSVRARMLLVHGTGDDNVHVQNTLQLADRLEGAGKVFSMLLYPNRTHSLSERNATPQLRESFTRFILENL